MHGFFDTDQPFTCLGVPFIGLRKKNGVLNMLGFECAVWILLFKIISLLWLINVLIRKDKIVYC